ncbi:hypothetical protein ABZS29_17675 [Kribbella sp. NPDC005582]|uniref:hypothetical protein n=1 Tax=Kribbella sp. NPDC005582 TaxID=3156893 RepID=UPI0033A8A0EB
MTVVVGPIFLVLSSALTLLDGDREWWTVVLRLGGAALLIWAGFEPRRLRRRVAVLSAND